MENEINNKIYKYGEGYYNIEEIYDLYKHIGVDKRKPMRDCICHYILSEIFKKGKNHKYEERLEEIANLEFQLLESNIDKKERKRLNSEYTKVLRRLLGLGGFINKYKRNELINGEWILNKLVSETIGSNYEIDDYHGFTFIKYDTLTNGECEAIEENFKRNIWNEPLVFYNSPKTLNKTIKKEV